MIVKWFRLVGQGVFACGYVCATRDEYEPRYRQAGSVVGVRVVD